VRRVLPRLFALGLLLSALPLLAACSGERAGADAPARGAAAAVTGGPAAETAPAARLARADFEVAGMDCAGCVLGTRAALRRLDGVERADATYDDATGRGTAWAEYDPARVTPERMAEAIGALGYTATPVATDEPG